MKRAASALAIGAVIAATLGALSAGPARAQMRVRTGFWVDAGLGYGRLRLRCANCTDVGTAHGGTMTLTFGRSLSRRVVLGLEGQIWSSWEAGRDAKMRSLTVVAQWYPFLKEHLFVRGGTGMVQGPIVTSLGGTTPGVVKGTGVGLTLGVGWDFPLDAHVAIAAGAATYVAALGDIVKQGVTLEDTIGYVTRVAVALVVR